MVLPDQIALRRFTLAEAAEAGGARFHTVRTWLRRDVLIGLAAEDDRPNPGRRIERHVSYGRVLQIAVVQVLVDLGIPAERAGLAALQFTHRAARDHSRMPACLWPSGSTVLVVPSEGDARCVHLPDSRLPVPLALPQGTPAAVLVDLNQLVRTVRARIAQMDGAP